MRSWPRRDLHALLLFLISAACDAPASLGAARPEISAAVEQARQILSARARAAGRLRSSPDKVALEESGPRAELLVPVSALFSGDDAGLAPSSSPLLSHLKDYVTTFHTPHLVVSWPVSSAGVDALGARRAVSLGFRLLKDCGLAPERLFVRSRTDREARARIVLSTVRPAAEDMDDEFKPVMIHAARREAGTGLAPAALDVVLLDSARVKRWTLALLSPEGEEVRRFEGGQDLFASVAWDGTDAAGRPLPQGLYQAFLAAETWAADWRTDSLAIAVKAPPAPAGAARPAAAAPAKTAPPRETGPDVAKWFHTVVFPPGESSIPGPMRLAVEQAARALRLYPGRRVSVEGFSAPDEKGGLRLAEARAARVQEALVGEHGIAPERVAAAGHPPRPPLEGEAMNKVLIFFQE